MKSIGGCDSIYIITDINVEHNFLLNINPSSNPVDSGETVTLTTSAIPSYTITAWQPTNLFSSQNSFSQNFIADTTTNISAIAISNAGCIDTANLLLVVTVPVNNDFFIPNAFSPGGKNNFFKVFGTTIQKAQMDIFNQWGQLIFEGNAITPGWDGSYKGLQQPVGVYIYYKSNDE